MTSDAKTNFFQTAGRLLRGHRLLNSTKHVCAGFSGGPDSTALLLFMLEQPVDVEAVHLHHGLRGAEADKDAEWCRSFCKERGIPFSLYHLDVPGRRGPAENIEAAARRCRLDFWAGYVERREKELGVGVAVALGHHADDALEDLFLRLGRGSSTSGLTALRPGRRMHGVTYIRPLLETRRDEILAFLEQEGITDSCKDQTNRDVSLRRNAIRHELLPLIRRIWGTDAGFRRSLDALREDAAYLETAAATRSDWEGDTAAFAALPHALQHRVLRTWLSRQLGRDVVPRHTALARLRTAVAPLPEAVTEVPIERGIALEVDRRMMRVKTSATAFEERTWAWRKEPLCRLDELGRVLHAELVPLPSRDQLRNAEPCREYFDPRELPPVLRIRPWKPGDRMIPFGHSTPRKVKDIFNAAGIPPIQRRGVPVLLANDQIIWAVGVRRGAHALPPANNASEPRRELPCVLRITYA